MPVPIRFTLTLAGRRLTRRNLERSIRLTRVRVISSTGPLQGKVNREIRRLVNLVEITIRDNTPVRTGETLSMLTSTPTRRVSIPRPRASRVGTRSSIQDYEHLTYFRDTPYAHLLEADNGMFSTALRRAARFIQSVTMSASFIIEFTFRVGDEEQIIQRTSRHRFSLSQFIPPPAITLIDGNQPALNLLLPRRINLVLAAA